MLPRHCNVGDDEDEEEAWLLLLAATYLSIMPVSFLFLPFPHVCFLVANVFCSGIETGFSEDNKQNSSDSDGSRNKQ
jgi:hypothetical protein